MFKPKSFNSKAQALPLHQPLALGKKSSRIAQPHPRSYPNSFATQMTHCGGHSSHRQLYESDPMEHWPGDHGYRLRGPDGTSHSAPGVQGPSLPFSPPRPDAVGSGGRDTQSQLARMLRAEHIQLVWKQPNSLTTDGTVPFFSNSVGAASRQKQLRAAGRNTHGDGALSPAWRRSLNPAQSLSTVLRPGSQRA